MKRFFLIALVLPSALLAGKADPTITEVVAANDTYAQAVNREGAWRATRAVAIPQTQSFIPNRTAADEFGASWPVLVKLSIGKTEQVWVSCGSTVGITVASWTIPRTKAHGWHEITWAKLRNGDIRMLLNHAGPTKPKLFSTPGRKGMRAACTATPPPLPIVAPAIGSDLNLGTSHDQTLIWSSVVSEKGENREVVEVRIVVSLWNGKAFEPVLEDCSAHGPAALTSCT